MQNRIFRNSKSSTNAKNTIHKSQCSRIFELRKLSNQHLIFLWSPKPLTIKNQEEPKLVKNVPEEESVGLGGLYFGGSFFVGEYVAGGLGVELTYSNVD